MNAGEDVTSQVFGGRRTRISERPMGTGSRRKDRHLGFTLNSTGNSHLVSLRDSISVSPFILGGIESLPVWSCLLFTHSLFINLQKEGQGRYCR